MKAAYFSTHSGSAAARMRCISSSYPRRRRTSSASSRFMRRSILAHANRVRHLLTPRSATARQPGLHHSAWQLGSFAELQAAHRELRELGIAVESTIEHNVTRSVYFHDPDGNRVELYCDMVEDGFDAMRTMGPRRDEIDIET